MKKLCCLVVLGMVLGLGQVAAAADDCSDLKAEKARLTANKKAAMEFFQLLVGDRDYETARSYVDGYFQHDPDLPGDGLDVLIHYLETSPKFKNRPRTTVTLYNVMADGDLVYFQSRKELKDPHDGSPLRILVQHCFRFNAKGKIVEHWSTATPVKMNTAKNPKALW